MSEPISLDLETEVRELFATKLREFAAFCGENWLTTATECETLTMPSSSPDEYARGYNDAMGQLEGAIEHWLDEYMGYGR